MSEPQTHTIQVSAQEQVKLARVIGYANNPPDVA